MKTRLLIGFALVAFAATSASADQGKPMKWTIDGVPRTALVFAPTAGGANEKHPVIFAFHGHGGDMTSTSTQMDFQTSWPEAVVVYPQGLPGRGVVNDTDETKPHKSGWQIWPGHNGDRDIKFFDRMLETMRQQFAVDDNRIYAVGFSNGAFFCYVLWAERRTTLAAMGNVAGALWQQPPIPTVLTGPLPVMQIAGIADSEITLAWQADTIEVDKKINNVSVKDGEPCGAACVQFPSSQAPLKFLLHNGGHEYLCWMTAEFVRFFKSQKRM